MSEPSTRKLRSRTVSVVTGNKHDGEKAVAIANANRTEVAPAKPELRRTRSVKMKSIEDDDTFIQLKSGTKKKKRRLQNEETTSSMVKQPDSSVKLTEVSLREVDELQQKSVSSTKILVASEKQTEATRRSQKASQQNEDVSHKEFAVTRKTGAETSKLSEKIKTLRVSSKIETSKTGATTPRTSSKIPSLSAKTRKSPRVAAAKSETSCVIENAKLEVDENRVEATTTKRTKSVEKSSITRRETKREVLKDVLVDQVPADRTSDNPKQHKVIREKIVCVKTPSMKETFKGRLAWKKKHYNQPVTSTPVAKKTKLAAPTVSSSALETSCPFDFDEILTEEENDYSVCLSPIRKAPRPNNPNEVVVVRKIEVKDRKPFRFNDLLVRYGEHDLKDEGELHVNPDSIKVTYGKSKTHFHKAVGFIEMPDKKPCTTSSKLPKRTRKAGGEHGKKEIENKEMEKWLEEKNKEFEAVEKTPLVVVRSPSQPQEA